MTGTTEATVLDGILDRIRILRADIQSASNKFDAESTYRAGADEALSHRLASAEQTLGDATLAIEGINTALAGERARIDALVAQLTVFGVDANI